MASSLTIVAATGFLRGPTADETGMNVSKFSITVKPEVLEHLPDIQGQSRGFAVGDPMADLTVEGEFVSTLAGLMLSTFVTAKTFANTTTFFGRSAGGFYLQQATVDKTRDQWNSATLEYQSRFNVA